MSDKELLDEIQKIKYRDPTSDYTRGFNSGVDATIDSKRFVSVKELREKIETELRTHAEIHELVECGLRSIIEIEDYDSALLVVRERMLPKSQEKKEI